MSPVSTPIDLVDRLSRFALRPAILDPLGTHSFTELDQRAAAVSVSLRDGRADLAEERVAILCRPGRDVVVALHASWRAGALPVALHPGHPAPELRRLMNDADCTAVIASATYLDLAATLLADTPGRLVALPGMESTDALGPTTDPSPTTPPVPFRPERAALMVFTSGTTGRPKGVVHTHASLTAQITGMVDQWEWSAVDRTLCVLPMHHIHGLVNATLTPLAVGAVLEAPGSFDPHHTWERLASGEMTVFTAVPTIYARLIDAWDRAATEVRERWSQGAAGLRLMISGSAALPVSMLDRWQELTGHVLLERYGMTEIGMALGNTLGRRIPGHVGEPFPGVELRTVDEADADLDPSEAGELLVRGPQVFREYWNRPEESAAAFVDGWFRTGDIAVRDEGGWRLLGRASTDIIKSGGEKVSAIEIEEAFREHPGLSDCAVVGLPDDEWGQRVVMAFTRREPSDPDDDTETPGGFDDNDAVSGVQLRRWGRERLAPAKVPMQFLEVTELPRNAMGKVTKPDVLALFTDREGTSTRDSATS